MNTILRITVLIVFLASHAFAGGGPDWHGDVKKALAAKGKVIAHIISWGNRIYTAATPEQIAKCPAWDTKSNPPLSVSDAIGLARLRVEKDNPTFGHLELDNVRFSHGDAGKWIYTIEFDGAAPLADGSNGRASFVADVMMDGTVLERQFYDDPSAQENELPIAGKPEVTRRAKDFPIKEAELHNVEMQMKNIIIPEVDYRQANWFDVVQFLDVAVSEYGPGGKGNDKRLKIRIGQHLTWKQHRALLPPHSTEWNGIPDPPLITFSSRQMPLFEALAIVINLGNLNYTIQGNVVSVNDPRTPAKQRGDGACPSN